MPGRRSEKETARRMTIRKSRGERRSWRSSRGMGDEIARERGGRNRKSREGQVSSSSSYSHSPSPHTNSDMKEKKLC